MSQEKKTFVGWLQHIEAKRIDDVVETSLAIFKLQERQDKIKKIKELMKKCNLQ